MKRKSWSGYSSATLEVLKYSPFPHEAAHYPVGAQMSCPITKLLFLKAVNTQVQPSTTYNNNTGAFCILAQCSFKCQPLNVVLVSSRKSGQHNMNKEFSKRFHLLKVSFHLCKGTRRHRTYSTVSFFERYPKTDKNYTRITQKSKEH